ncbi:MAG: response regulator transcription factor [Candidatus Nanopelagicales bacterium]|nr:response regulator transcription factor [Candidatus Nanopelagicales bacterium]
MSSNKPVVLVVDDEAALTKVVASYLIREGFDTCFAHDGPSAVEVAKARRPDLIILDVMLPGFDGFEVCRRIRTFSDAYVLMLTARDDETDAVVGLSVGADDYVVKPFGPRELVARAKALLRRPRAEQSVASEPYGGEPLICGDLVIDPVSRRVHVAGQEVALTRTEFDILSALAARPKAAFTRRQLIEAVWGSDWVGGDQIVDVHIGHIRGKLGDDASEPRYVRTIRGIGYGLSP